MNKVTLYGLDKKGGHKLWQIWTDNDSLFISHGKEGGKMQLKEEKIAGKNIGKSNETTPTEQAELEAQSRINKQIDRGYRYTKEELDEIPLAAMLAVDWHKMKHKVEFPCYVSPKLDGLRCLAIKTKEGVKLQSRGNKEYHIPHIIEALDDFMEVGDVFDGEVYKHGLALQEITSAAKKANANTTSLEFWVFDVVKLAEGFVRENSTFESRLDALVNLSIMDYPDCLEFLDYTKVSNETDLQREHDSAVDRGFEGLMIRNPKGKYESGKRSNDLQKFKVFKDDEFLIIGVTEDRNGNAVLTVKNKFADNTFTVVGGSFEERKLWLENPSLVVGKYATIQYQTLYKDTNLPQFPTMKGFRTEEDMPLPT